MLLSRSCLEANLFFPFSCLRDLIWETITLFLVATSSRQAEQNSLPALTTKCSSGYSLTRSTGPIVLGLATTRPFPRLWPVGGRFSLIFLFRDKVDGVGERSRLKRDAGPGVGLDGLFFFFYILFYSSIPKIFSYNSFHCTFSLPIIPILSLHKEVNVCMRNKLTPLYCNVFYHS